MAPPSGKVPVGATSSLTFCPNGSVGRHSIVSSNGDSHGPTRASRGAIAVIASRRTAVAPGRTDAGTATRGVATRSVAIGGAVGRPACT